MPESPPYRRVLALLDFDALDGRIVGKALLLARQNGAALDVLHLIEPDGLHGGAFGGGANAAARALERAAERRMIFLTTTLGADDAVCRALHGPRRQRLMQYVAARRPDLVVTGDAQTGLGDLCDTLILSTPARPRGGRLRTALRAWLGLGPGAARA